MPKHLRYGREKPLLYRTSFIKTNLAARTFSFLGASFSFGKMPSFKYEAIVVVQLLSEPISYTLLESISGEI